MSAKIVKPIQIAILIHFGGSDSDLFHSWLQKVKSQISEGVVLEHEKQFVEEILNFPTPFTHDQSKKILAKVLANANFESVYYCYPSDEERTNFEIYMHSVENEGPNAEALKTAKSQVQSYAYSLDYQSCERNDWNSSFAKVFLDLVVKGTDIDDPIFEDMKWLA